MVTAAEARRRAERCLAVARSTTHEGERQAAIGRAEKILAPHGLIVTDLAPGRPERSATTVFGTVADWLARMADTLERQAAAAGAGDDETIYAARRRNFDAACAAARERDRRRGRVFDR